MKIRKLTQSGISHYVVPLVAVVLVAVVGTFLLVRSHAETPGYLGFANYRGAATAGGGGGKPITAINVPRVFTAQDNLPGIGPQYVSEIPPAGKLVYGNTTISTTTNTKVEYSQICYYIRVINSPKSARQVASAGVTFAGIRNSVTRILPVDDKYRSVCVNTGSGAQANYNIWNRSSVAYVLVYEAVNYR